jgi:energy-coupling factor transporter ATP-binding protein EcfA2
VITEVRVRNRKKIPAKWWPKVTNLARRKVFRLKPGLNILWGRNGSGKTTLLKSIARTLHAEQGGQTIVTPTSLNACFGLFGHEENDYLNGLHVVHDGQGVLNFDPDHTVGLQSGYFDDDFFDQGLRNLMLKESSGITTLAKMSAIAETVFLGDPWPGIAWKVRKDDTRAKLVEETLKGELPKGQPTVLMDEPDRSLDLPHRVGIWKRLPEKAGDFQFIVATHSVLALNVPGANYIELSKGYLKECRASLKRFLPLERAK